MLSPRHGIGKRILISLKLAATFAKSDNDVRSAFEPPEVTPNDIHSGASLNLKPSNHENCACSKAKVPFVTKDGSANSDLDVDMETCARCCTTDNAHERAGNSKENNPNQPPITNDGDWDNQPTLSTGSPADSQIYPPQSDSGGISDDVNLNSPQFPYYPWECAAISSGRHKSKYGGVYLYWCY